jgi:hypothetical protein
MEVTMEPQAADTLIRDLIKAMRHHLETAASVAKAGATCAEAGSPARAVDIVIELGDDLHEVNRLLAAVLAVNQYAKK